MIRAVRPEDGASIAAIYNDYILHSVITFDTEPIRVGAMQSFISRVVEQYPFFVYEEGSVVQGYCYAHLWKSKPAYAQTWETTLYLSPAVQGKGIGTRLLERLVAESRSKGCKALIACITEGNTASEALHRKLGFKQVSHFEKVGFKGGRLLDVVDYELVL